MATQPIALFTPEQYLEFDRASDVPHEYISGEIVPMQGATPWHSLIAANTGSVLRTLVSPLGCRVFESSLRVCVNRATTYAHPDVTLICGELTYMDSPKETVTNPCLVVEVLSPSTRDYDLGQKLRQYWSIASLTDILLIEQERVWIEYWFRAPGGEWSKRVFESLSDTVHVASRACDIPVAEIYAGVEFPVEAQP